MAFVVRSRANWGAEPPRKPPVAVKWRGKILFVHHTAVPFAYKSTTRAGRIREEQAHMRRLQQIGFERGFADISYNYIVFPSGRVYAGRGARVHGAHTAGGKPGYEDFYNDHPGVAFPGDYESVRKLTKAQILGLASLRLRLRARYLISRKRWPHLKVHATLCPGRNVVQQLGLPK